MSRRTARPEPAPAGLHPYAQIRGTVSAARDGLFALVRRGFADAGLDLRVSGDSGDEGALLLLAYQTVLESNASSTVIPLVPQSGDAAGNGVPDPWRRVSRLVSQLLLEVYPKRETRSPGLGPLDPLPPLAALPPPLRDWYDARSERWVVPVGGRPHGRLPFLGWRQPFPLAVRFAAMVPRAVGPDADRGRLEALGVVAAVVRLGRSFEFDAPPYPAEPDLLALAKAFSAIGGPAGDELAELLPALTAPRLTSTGLTAHHELSDADLAEIARTLGVPIRPAIVFSVRLALGGGVELSTGALPHLGGVTAGDR